MAEFQYRIITPAGKEKKGTLEGRNADAVTQALKAEKNIVLQVSEASLMSKDINLHIGGKKVKPRDFSIFCRQFVSILKAGVSIIAALEMMKEQTENKTLRKAVNAVHEDVSKGESLSVALRNQKEVFPSMLCNMVEAGEASGSLEIAFERMAIQFEKNAKIRAQLKKALTYPVILVVVMFAVLVVMLAFVIPSFMKMFEDIGTELPAITMVVVHMSDFMKAYWWLLVIIIIAIVIGLKVYAQTAGGKLVMGRLAINIPLFGKIQRKTACAQFARTMCTLLGAGVSMVEALEITAKSLSNIIYKNAVSDCREQVMRGVSLAKAIKSSKLFPNMVTQMIAIGEDTGNIEEMLENIARYYEEDVENMTASLSSIIEPAIIVFMAVMIGFLILAILSPMAVLYDSLSGAE